MKRINLDGKWTLRDLSTEKNYCATIPGLNYLDLMENGEIRDPFKAEFDSDYAWIADTEWIYIRNFEIKENDLNAEKIELHFERLDTLATVQINGEIIGETNNIHLKYSFDIKSFLHAGQNEITVTFHSLKKYIEQRQKLLSLPHNAMGTTGHPHVRKCACHFGWDFAAQLAMQGISGHCEIRFIDLSRITDFLLEQKFSDEKAVITVNIKEDIDDDDSLTKVELVYPDGEIRECVKPSAKENEFEFIINEPKLWWCNGLGEQPLYTVIATIKANDEILDSMTKRIGIRKIEIDTKKDKYGNNFQFVINNIPIFAKGANYISPDLLYTRITREKLYKILSYCKQANINMIRVWGGGFYESDDFYEICDELGILVWQDCAFACCAYPFILNDFLENVQEEIKENVKRIMHHPSLAIWCGNNEIESISLAWITRKNIIDSTGKFFYEILPSLIREYDKVTPYHACSPSSGTYMKKVNDDESGDTHIWNVWHGFQYKEYFLKRYSRFSSEFGMQSYPCSGVMPHQKCDLGDERLKYYLTKHFTFPNNDEDMRYLTQLIQLETMKTAVEHFRQNSDRCHGALYWQLNDCWDSVSWAAIDYNLNKKALLYSTKHFNESVHVSAVKVGNKLEIYLSNDTVNDVRGKLIISVAGTDENEYVLSDYSVIATANSNSKADTLNCLNFSKSKDIIILRLYSFESNIISENRVILCENNELKLISPEISYTYKLNGNEIAITLTAENYARYVAIRIDDEINNFSENYFDLSAGKSKTITANLKSAENLESRIHIRTVYDALLNRNKLRDMRLHNEMTFLPMSMLNRISRYFE